MNFLLDTLDRQFSHIHLRSCDFAGQIPQDKLYWKPRLLPRTFTMFSSGEYLLRSAAAVEQSFGGITRRLWDDPFEWTLPEKLSTNEKLIEYLDEVEQTRRNGFSFFRSDLDLQKVMPAPETMRSIFEILVDTIARAEHFQGRAFAVSQTFSDDKLPPR